jgi:hypothetical protein
MTTLKDLAVKKYNGLLFEQKKQAIANHLIENGFCANDSKNYFCTNDDWLLSINISFHLHEKSMKFLNRKKGVNFSINYVEHTTEELIQKINDIVIDAIENTPC